MSGTVRKMGPILDLFTAERPDWGVSEVAQAIGIPRSSAHTLLASLVEIGLLRTGDRGRYRIGRRSIELGDVLRSTSDLQVAAAPVVEALSHRLGETAQLAVLHRWRALPIDTVAGPRPVSVTPPTAGLLMPPHSTAVGKVLLAQVDRLELRSLFLSSPPPATTSSAVTGVDALMKQLADVRQRGFAVENEENEVGLCGAAAPVTDDAGSGIAALGVLVPADRFQMIGTQVIREVVSAAEQVSARLAARAHRVAWRPDAADESDDPRETDSGPL